MGLVDRETLPSHQRVPTHKTLYSNVIRFPDTAVQAFCFLLERWRCTTVTVNDGMFCTRLHAGGLYDMWCKSLSVKSVGATDCSSNSTLKTCNSVQSDCLSTKWQTSCGGGDVSWFKWTTWYTRWKITCGFISCIHLVRSPEKAFGESRLTLDIDWMNLLSMTGSHSQATYLVEKPSDWFFCSSFHSKSPSILVKELLLQHSC